MGTKVDDSMPSLGLPFNSVRQNVVNAVSYVTHKYKRAIAEYDAKSATSAYADVRDNAARYRDFLRDFVTLVRENTPT
jgi:hypothetical protein